MIEVQKPSMRIGARGIYLLPNLFTVGAMFAGFYAIIAATHYAFENAAIAIFIAMILDGLDGRVARLTHTQTEFGAQMDNMSDMVSFGVTPALVFYEWALGNFGKIGWLAAFIYTVCTALRLARFLSMDDHEDKRFSRGITTTAAAGFMASFLWFCTEHGFSGQMMGVVALILTIMVALLKVSTIPYRSFKDFDARGRIPFLAVVMIALVLAFIALDPPDVFLAMSSAYLLSGPVEYVVVFFSRTKHKARRGKVVSIPKRR